MKKTLLFIYQLTTALMPLANAQNKPVIVAGNDIAVVQTEAGRVRGYIQHDIYTFKGIPYGAAERFMPAAKPLPWTGIRNCMAYGPTCPTNSAPSLADEFEFALQPNRGYHTDENCLNLNIWTPGIHSRAKKPVMVWLHGGGFSSGSSIEFPSLDGQNLSRTGDVVVVSLNHRLNVLGFLDLSAYDKKYAHAANAGAMDMVLALTWIKENIANFGGDPANITIFGQSGGGAKVMCLMNAPAAKGLFHKAIVQSGSYLTHFTEPGIAKRISAALLDELGLQPGQVHTLQTMPYAQLEAAGQKAIQKIQQTLLPGDTHSFGLEWEPVHDGTFLPYQPHEPEALALSKNIPLIVGSVKNEYNPFIPGTRGISMDNATAKLREKYADKTAAYIAVVKEAYPATTEPADYLDIDFIFRPLVIAHANQRSAHTTAPVYTYLFTWQSPVLDRAFKAMHCMDLPFVFNNIQACPQMTGGAEDAYTLATRMSQAWVHFARTGDPNHAGLPPWPQYTPANGAVMILDEQCEVKARHDAELLRIATEK